LRLDADPAEDGNHTELSVFAVFPKAFLNLGGELARRGENENTDAVSGVTVRISDRGADQIVDNRKPAVFPVPV
jgi:hypothetical protein